MKILAALMIMLGVPAMSGHSDAARVPCADSNGARPGGVVYVGHRVRLTCDVSPPQRLAVTRVPSRGICDDMGGRYAPLFDICWDVDY